MTHLYEVDVPIRSTETPTLRGVHVFTGLADSRSAAVRIAHEVYDAALRSFGGRTRDPPRSAGRLGCLLIPARLGARLARRDGRPLEEPGQLAQLQPLRAVALPRDSRSA